MLATKTPAPRPTRPPPEKTPRPTKLLKYDCSIRSYGHSDDVGDEGGEPDEARKVCRILFVASGDLTAAFHSAKESFDQFTMFVNHPVVSLLLFASGVSHDVSFGPELPSTLEHRLGIVRGVGNDRTRVTTAEAFQQRFSLRTSFLSTNCQRWRTINCYAPSAQDSFPSRDQILDCRPLLIT